MASDPWGPILPELHGAPAEAAAVRSLGRPAIGRLVRDPAFLVGAAVILFWVLAAVEWRIVSPYDPFAVSAAQPLLPPGRTHWLGTDDLGRDVFSRVLAGAAPVLVIAPAATALSLVGGTTMGLVAGFYRGLVDDVLMRLLDAVMSLPVIIPATLVLSLTGRSSKNVILGFAVLFSPLVAL